MLIPNACTAVAVGAACALAGVFTGPRVPERINLDRALAAAILATAAACAWSLWRHELVATILTFVVVTYVVGDFRARRGSGDDGSV